MRAGAVVVVVAVCELRGNDRGAGPVVPPTSRV
jgi:hypothetical protein